MLLLIIGTLHSLLVNSRLIRETNENESANASYKFGQD